MPHRAHRGQVQRGATVRAGDDTLRLIVKSRCMSACAACDVVRRWFSSPADNKSHHTARLRTVLTIDVIVLTLSHLAMHLPPMHHIPHLRLIMRP